MTAPRPDVASLARLHLESLPRSAVTMLGEGYARAFYRYLSQSSDEVLAWREDVDGGVIAAAVVTLSPATLNRRLVLKTPILFHALRRAPKIAAALMARPPSSAARRGGAHVPARRPQLILLFTSERHRGRGIGASLVADVEARLRERGVSFYEVRTELDSANRALDFYRRLGFKPEQVSVRWGTPFQVFTRNLTADHST